MPLKKKGSKKRKKAGSGTKTTPDGEDKVDPAEADDPSTMMSPRQPAQDGNTKGKKGKRKKKKKVKMTRSERAQEKLEKAIALLKEDDAYYDSFIDRTHQWLVDRAEQAIMLFQKMDVDGEGAVTTDEFKAGLFDLNVPLTAVEVHLLVRLLDPEDIGEIDYIHLKLGLCYARESFDIEKEQEFESLTLIKTARKFPKCPCCKVSIAGPYKELKPRYIDLSLRMVTFDKFSKYPGHLKMFVHSHLLVCGLIQMIIQETEITSSKIGIFRDTSRSREALLPAKSTLEECGFLGDSKLNPEKVMLYYDYTVEFTDCPILLCDHYFGQKLKAQNVFS